MTIAVDLGRKATKQTNKMSLFIKCGRINIMGAYQKAGRGGGVRESAVKWSGKNEFWSGKSQGISFQTKSGHPVNILVT